ncbi:Hypothetical protein NTJ_04789 [Nesidiocoris tenuis]|uniref:ZBR-type domain-containing protein n=1 Tax=Nesidiocoris tenuis TaxID=355587 RepID=A0ABN7AM61_9HEMI|nr:Hypothetical protein NTJ_04789 [Nesidiocoris tenuis]
MSDKTDTFNSPMEVVYSWAPQDTSTVASKRKTKDDSGYDSPSSSAKSESSQIAFSAPTVDIFTPLASRRESWKRLKSYPSFSDTDKILDGGVGEVYAEPLAEEPSMYSEPMDLDQPSFVDLSGDPTDVSIVSPSQELDAAFEIALTNPCPSTPVASPQPRTAQSTVRRLRKNPTPVKRFPLSAPECISSLCRPKQRNSLCGIPRVDILAKVISTVNMSDIVARILNNLSGEDLSNVVMVSKTWRAICLEDPIAKSRWQHFVGDRKCNVENLPVQKRSIEKDRSRNSGPMMNISNQTHHSTPLSTRQPTSPPCSPCKNDFDYIRLPDRRLTKCPRCGWTSVCSPQLHVGECLSLTCQWKFCCRCSCDAHLGKDCPLVLSSPKSSPTKSPVKMPNSKKARLRYLRRL